MPILFALLALPACNRGIEAEDKVVRVDVTGDVAIERFDAAASRCGAEKTLLIEREGRTKFIVGRSNSAAARGCFLDWARADRKARHPVRAALGL